MNKGILIITSLLLLATLLLPSCGKQGCTDSKAFNYDPSAKSENGTCLYCDTNTFHATVTQRVRDQDSVFNVFDAADFVFRQTGFTQKGNGCKAIGLHTGDGCSVALTIRNLTNKHMMGSYSIFFSNSEGKSWSSFDSFGTINPNDSVVINPVVTQQCDSIDKGFFNIQLSNTSYF